MLTMRGFKKIKFALGLARQRAIYRFLPWLGLVYEPILIYSMGKVGSTSVQTTLERARLPNPIFHIHFLNWESLNELDAVIRVNGGFAAAAGHVTAGKHLRAFADLMHGFRGGALQRLFKSAPRWKIITLVREPIGREVSDLFENLRTFSELSELAGEPLAQAAVARMRDWAAGFDERDEYACQWFDRELKQVFGFDIYAAGFEPVKGYAIYRAEMADILLIRLEDLSRCGPEALQQFLGLRGRVDMLKANQGAAKSQQQQVYKSVLERLTFPVADVEKIYGSRYVRYFYSPAEIHAYAEKWTEDV